MVKPVQHKRYSTLVLDCDGVILDSNQLKTRAMVEALSGYPEDLIHQFINYHQENGGVSRYVKLEYFLREMADSYSENELNRLLGCLSEILKDRLNQASYTEGARTFIEQMSTDHQLFVVSGGDQQELRSVFEYRGDSRYFEAIFGSPDSKFFHCRNIANRLGPNESVLMIGDARVDHESALDAGFDFTFVYGYTDFDDWESYCDQHKIEKARNLEQIQKRFSV